MIEQPEDVKLIETLRQRCAIELFNEKPSFELLISGIQMLCVLIEGDEKDDE